MVGTLVTTRILFNGEYQNAWINSWIRTTGEHRSNERPGWVDVRFDFIIPTNAEGIDTRAVAVPMVKNVISCDLMMGDVDVNFGCSVKTMVQLLPSKSAPLRAVCIDRSPLSFW